jgi:hypothetical protein
MFPTSHLAIRAAVDADAPALRRLAERDSAAPLAGEIILAELGGAPAAALSLADGRVVADPFQRTAQLVTALRMHAQLIRSYRATPSLRDRLRAFLAPARRLAVRPA